MKTDLSHTQPPTRQRERRAPASEARVQAPIETPEPPTDVLGHTSLQQQLANGHGAGTHPSSSLEPALGAQVGSVAGTAEAPAAAPNPEPSFRTASASGKEGAGAASADNVADALPANAREEEEEEEELCCGICLQPIAARGILSCCDHRFCAACILRWVAVATNRCPFCAARVRAVTDMSTGESVTVPDREQRPEPHSEDLAREVARSAAAYSATTAAASLRGAAGARAGGLGAQSLSAWDAQRLRLSARHAHISPWQIAISLWQAANPHLHQHDHLESGVHAASPEGGDAQCIACGEGGLLLLCDRCDDPWHPGCLPHPLAGIPEGEWFCPWCAELRRQLAADALRRARAPSPAASRFRIPKSRRASSAAG